MPLDIPENQVPYSDNVIKKGSAEDTWENEWDNISNVTAVVGGVDDSGKCFKFGPTASMKQTVNIPGQPPTMEFNAFFLPGKDIRSSSHIKAEIVVTFVFGDGSTAQYVVPGKYFY